MDNISSSQNYKAMRWRVLDGHRIQMGGQTGSSSGATMAGCQFCMPSLAEAVKLCGTILKTALTVTD